MDKSKIGRRFQGKVAIVTASTQGIGFAIAQRLGLEGASVVISSRRQGGALVIVDLSLCGYKSHSLDVDGSTRAGRKAACGGIIRDSHGNWVAGFLHNLGMGTFTLAELLAIHDRFQLCCSLDLDGLRIYSDSLDAIHPILTDVDPTHPLSEEILLTRRLLLSFKDAQVIHAYREALTCADHLAFLAYSADIADLGPHFPSF